MVEIEFASKYANFAFVDDHKFFPWLQSRSEAILHGFGYEIVESNPELHATIFVINPHNLQTNVRYVGGSQLDTSGPTYISGFTSTLGVSLRVADSEYAYRREYEEDTIYPETISASLLTMSTLRKPLWMLTYYLYIAHNDSSPLDSLASSTDDTISTLANQVLDRVPDTDSAMGRRSSATCENVNYDPEVFVGKPVRFYGRLKSTQKRSDEQQSYFVFFCVGSEGLPLIGRSPVSTIPATFAIETDLAVNDESVGVYSVNGIVNGMKEFEVGTWKLNVPVLTDFKLGEVQGVE